MNVSKNETANVVNANAQNPVEGRKSNSRLFDKKWEERVPEHTRNLVRLIRGSNEIRRFTALGILNYLLQKGEIKGEKRYVEFLWNKFQVKVDGLTREYPYTEPFFLNALVASYASAASLAQRTINTFCKAEMSVGIEKAVDSDEVNEIVSSNEEHTNNLLNESED